MELLVNGKTYEIEVQSDDTLLWLLRDSLELTGQKYGCGEGACGACTVLLDGKAIRSCITSASSTKGKSITTVEGLASDGKLHVIQDAFRQVDVFQCAYCASGMVVSAVSLLSSTPHPTEEEIIHGMQGNICRCGTYPRIVKAIKIASNQ
jgi:aerobic-type carbon monoxide dehydrogenase small subunit (CoxS/CutS family)